MSLRDFFLGCLKCTMTYQRIHGAHDTDHNQSEKEKLHNEKAETVSNNKIERSPFMKTIYTTKEYKGFGKEYFRNEYRLEKNTVSKVQCRRAKFFDGRENKWESSEKLLGAWKKSDSPDWLKRFFK